MKYSDRYELEKENKINRILNRFSPLCVTCKHSLSKHSEHGCLASILTKGCGCKKFVEPHWTDFMTEEDKEAPYGRCEKCGHALAHEIDGADADGHRGQMITYCVNEDCPDFAG